MTTVSEQVLRAVHQALSTTLGDPEAFDATKTISLDTFCHNMEAVLWTGLPCGVSADEDMLEVADQVGFVGGSLPGAATVSRVVTPAGDVLFLGLRAWRRAGDRPPRLMVMCALQDDPACLPLMRSSLHAYAARTGMFSDQDEAALAMCASEHDDGGWALASSSSALLVCVARAMAKGAHAQPTHAIVPREQNAYFDTRADLPTPVDSAWLANHVLLCGLVRASRWPVCEARGAGDSEDDEDVAAPRVSDAPATGSVPGSAIDPSGSSRPAADTDGGSSYVQGTLDRFAQPGITPALGSGVPRVTLAPPPPTSGAWAWSGASKLGSAKLQGGARLGLGVLTGGKTCATLWGGHPAARDACADAGSSWSASAQLARALLMDAPPAGTGRVRLGQGHAFIAATCQEPDGGATAAVASTTQVVGAWADALAHGPIASTLAWLAGEVDKLDSAVPLDMRTTVRRALGQLTNITRQAACLSVAGEHELQVPHARPGASHAGLLLQASAALAQPVAMEAPLFQPAALDARAPSVEHPVVAAPAVLRVHQDARATGRGKGTPQPTWVPLQLASIGACAPDVFVRAARAVLAGDGEMPVPGSAPVRVQAQAQADAVAADRLAALPRVAWAGQARAGVWRAVCSVPGWRHGLVGEGAPELWLSAARTAHAAVAAGLVHTTGWDPEAVLGAEGLAAVRATGAVSVRSKATPLTQALTPDVAGLSAAWGTLARDFVLRHTVAHTPQTLPAATLATRAAAVAQRWTGTPVDPLACVNDSTGRFWRCATVVDARVMAALLPGGTAPLLEDLSDERVAHGTPWVMSRLGADAARAMWLRRARDTWTEATRIPGALHPDTACGLYADWLCLHGAVPILAGSVAGMAYHDHLVRAGVRTADQLQSAHAASAMEAVTCMPLHLDSHACTAAADLGVPETRRVPDRARALAVAIMLAGDCGVSSSLCEDLDVEHSGLAAEPGWLIGMETQAALYWEAVTLAVSMLKARATRAHAVVTHGAVPPALAWRSVAGVAWQLHTLLREPDCAFAAAPQFSAPQRAALRAALADITAHMPSTLAEHEPPQAWCTLTADTVRAAHAECAALDWERTDAWTFRCGALVPAGANRTGEVAVMPCAGTAVPMAALGVALVPALPEVPEGAAQGLSTFVAVAFTPREAQEQVVALLQRAAQGLHPRVPHPGCTTDAAHESVRVSALLAADSTIDHGMRAVHLQREAHAVRGLLTDVPAPRGRSDAAQAESERRREMQAELKALEDGVAKSTAAFHKARADALAAALAVAPDQDVYAVPAHTSAGQEMTFTTQAASLAPPTVAWELARVDAADITSVALAGCSALA